MTLLWFLVIKSFLPQSYLSSSLHCSQALICPLTKWSSSDSFYSLHISPFLRHSYRSRVGGLYIVWLTFTRLYEHVVVLLISTVTLCLLTDLLISVPTQWNWCTIKKNSYWSTGKHHNKVVMCFSVVLFITFIETVETRLVRLWKPSCTPLLTSRCLIKMDYCKFSHILNHGNQKNSL